MMTEDEKQKQQRIQAVVDAMPEHGWERLVKLKWETGLREFQVEFDWLNGTTERAAGRVLGSGETGQWRIKLPNVVYELAFARLNNGEIQDDPPKKNERTTRHKAELIDLIGKWGARGNEPEWETGTNAARILSAATTSSGKLRIDGYKDFRFEHQGAFVSFAKRNSKSDGESGAMSLAKVDDVWGIRIPSRDNNDRSKHKFDVEIVMKAAASLNENKIDFVWLKKDKGHFFERSKIAGIELNQPVNSVYHVLVKGAEGHDLSSLHVRVPDGDEARHRQVLGQVLALLKANDVVVTSDWSRLADFTVNDSRGWAAYRHSRFCGNLILEGVPGTGKTYALTELANGLDSRKTIAVGRFATVMHPATSYEDFVEGLRPGAPKVSPSGATTVKLLMSAKEAPITTDLVPAPGSSDQLSPVWFFQPSATSSSSGFSIHDGFFVAACAEAVRNPDAPYVVLLDELNRCNIPKVMGDLITTMEVSKRAEWDAVNKQWNLSSAQVVTLPYSKRLFFVPDNVTIVGTMNTTDRSVAPMDAALRRRFVFVRVEPKFPEYEDETPSFTAARSQVVELNKALKTYLGADALLGHSYFYDMKREIDDGGDAAAVTRFYFDKVIFPMVVDTLVNNGCLAELNEANGAKADAPAAVFRRALETVATLEFSGRGITQMLKLSLL